MFPSMGTRPQPQPKTPPDLEDLEGSSSAIVLFVVSVVMRNRREIVSSQGPKRQAPLGAAAQGSSNCSDWKAVPMSRGWEGRETQQEIGGES